MLLNHLGCYDFQSKARIAESVVFQQAFTGFCDFQSKTKNTDSLDFQQVFYRFFCFPIQSNMRFKASCCFTKIKFPSASQSSLDHSKLTLTKLHFFFENCLKGSCVFQSTTKIAESLVFQQVFIGCYDFQSKARIAESVVFKQVFIGFCDFQSKAKITDSLDFQQVFICFCICKFKAT